MNYLKKFNEEIGFDDEEMRDRLEIPNLKGELEPTSPSMAQYYTPSDKINTQTEIKKILFRYPVLERFFTDSKLIEGSRLSSFYATSKEPIDNIEYYTQLSIAYHDKQYYVGTVLRNRENYENEDDWVVHSFFFEEIDDAFLVTEAFLKCCVSLGVIDRNDLGQYDFLFN